MFRLSALALFAATVALAAPVPKGEKKLYFPTAVGAKMVLGRTAFNPGQRAGVVSEFTETVTRVEEKDGVFTVAVETDYGRKPTTVSYRVSGEGLFGISDEADPYPLIRLSAAAGETWQRGKAGQHTTTYTMGKAEAVEVPAGKFTALRVDSVVTSPTGSTGEQVTHWYAPGVGKVKVEVTISGHPVMTIELKEFTPGTGEKKDEPKKGK